jgi:hypothetical protein
LNALVEYENNGLKRDTEIATDMNYLKVDITFDDQKDSQLGSGSLPHSSNSKVHLGLMSCKMVIGYL